MNAENLQKLSRLVDKRYADLSLCSRRNVENRLGQLLEQRRLPQRGWSEPELELLMRELALLDMNNFSSLCGVGEREGRIVCPLVRRRHFSLAHGIGRSGDVTAHQPKAAGSSAINNLTNCLLADWLRHCGCKQAAAAAVLVPVATGMALCLCLLTLKRSRPAGARFVLWPRIDQKSCFKAITAAGCEPVVIEPLLSNDQLITNVDAVQQMVQQLGADNIVAVMTTTSCFAPRTPDRLADIAVICKSANVPHLVNNAYGVQADRCMNLINDAACKGRLDLFVQSCDKNLLVPVGGAVIASPKPETVATVAANYPGRASIAPAVDALLTLLHLGRDGYDELRATRRECFQRLRDGLQQVASKYGLSLLGTELNPISLAISLQSVPNPTEVGSRLFRRGCSGARVVTGDALASIDGFQFVGYGAHCVQYPQPYLNAAAAVGMTTSEVDTFLTMLDDALAKQIRKHHLLTNHSDQISNS